MIKVYYNEIDDFACAWLSNLMDAGAITPGKIDNRSIVDVRPDELFGYDRCHFFAGIGVWDYALNVSGWGRRPVWTGSCPCQPFSSAGKGDGFADERHLWPYWHYLIEHGKRPEIPIFGEQVANTDALAWLDLVQADMEGAHHAVRAVDLCAAGFGAPHIRQRLYFVADPNDPQWRADRTCGDFGYRQEAGREQGDRDARERGTGEQLVNAAGSRPLPGAQRAVCGGEKGTGTRDAEPQRPGATDGLADPTGRGQRELRRPSGDAGQPDLREQSHWMAYGERERLERHGGHGYFRSQPGRLAAGPYGSIAAQGATCQLADTEGGGQQGAAVRSGSGLPADGAAEDGGARRMDIAQCERAGGGHRDGTGAEGAPQGGRPQDAGTDEAGDAGATRGMGDTQHDGSNGIAVVRGDEAAGAHPAARADNAAQPAGTGAAGDDRGVHGSKGQPDGGADAGTAVFPGASNGWWRPADWLLCRDGKWRPVESLLEPLADGVADDLGYMRVEGYEYSLQPLIPKEKAVNRVGRLKGYGNAVVAAVAIEFVQAYMEDHIEYIEGTI